MSGGRVFQKVWDMDSPYCPNGHIKDGPKGCMRLVIGRKGKDPHPVCNVRKRDIAKAALARRKAGLKSTGPGRPAKGVDINTRKEGEVKPSWDGGTELSGSSIKAYIQLVCGHIVIYDRGLLSFSKSSPNYDEELFCYTDRDWFKVHKIGAAFVKDQAMVLYPLEVAAEKAFFLQSEFFRMRDVDKKRSEKSIPFNKGHSAFRNSANEPGAVVGSLEDLRLAGGSTSK